MPTASFEQDGAAFAACGKVAALLLAMSKESAARLLKHFDEDELRLLVRSTAVLGAISPFALSGIVTEFAATVSADPVVQGGPAGAEALLAGVLPADTVRQMLADDGAAQAAAVWQRLGALPPDAVAQALAREHPQAAAYMLAQTSAATVAAVLSALPGAQRSEIMQRFLGMAPVSAAARALVEGELHDTILPGLAKPAEPQAHIRVAEIVNKLERAEMESLLADIAVHRPDDARRVRSLVFTFEDIPQLSDAARAALFAQVQAERIIPALANADPALVQLVLAVVPGRARRMIEQELAVSQDTPAKETAQARRAIAELALSLAARGEISLLEEPA